MSTCITFSMEVEPLVFTTPLSCWVWPVWLPWVSALLVSLLVLLLFPPQPVSMDRAMAAARARLNNFFMVILLTFFRRLHGRLCFFLSVFTLQATVYRPIVKCETATMLSLCKM